MQHQSDPNDTLKSIIEWVRRLDYGLITPAETVNKLCHILITEQRWDLADDVVR
jgi:hypothetical protein